MSKKLKVNTTLKSLYLRCEEEEIMEKMKMKIEKIMNDRQWN